MGEVNHMPIVSRLWQKPELLVLLSNSTDLQNSICRTRLPLCWIDSSGSAAKTSYNLSEFSCISLKMNLVGSKWTFILVS